MKTLSPFVLEEALAGAPVCDTNGNSVRILGCDESLGDYCVAGVHDGDLCAWRKDGQFKVSGVSHLDLRMVEPFEPNDEMCERFARQAWAMAGDANYGDKGMQDRDYAISRHALKLLAAHGIDVAGVCGE